jgi:hypothetical protein
MVAIKFLVDFNKGGYSSFKKWINLKSYIENSNLLLNYRTLRASLGATKPEGLEGLKPHSYSKFSPSNPSGFGLPN